jgi:hypothetical protein
VTILPSERPSDLGRSNCDSLSPKRSSNAGVMNRGSTDEAVVIVKFGAGDFMVTWMRIKHRNSNRRLEVKGGTCKRPWPLIIDWQSEISRIGTCGYPRRKQWTNRWCKIDERQLQLRVK